MHTETRSHIHALIDQFAAGATGRARTILQSMLDPLSRKLALAPIDDEPFAEEGRAAGHCRSRRDNGETAI